MIAAASFNPRPRLDEPWRRLAWIAPAAILLWGLLLVAFTYLLQDTGRPPAPIERLDARLIDLPASTSPGGLQSEAEPAAPPAPPARRNSVEQKPAALPVPRLKKKKDAPPPLYDAHGARTAPAIEAEEPTAGSSSPSDAGNSAASAGPAGGIHTGGLGADRIGARAIYAPVPKIPDDLRENVFEAVAVAHFEVNFDGDAKVSLTQPTSNPRLNVLLLDTLKQWRFFPAMRNGIAVDSQFDVRIPMAVR